MRSVAEQQKHDGSWRRVKDMMGPRLALEVAAVLEAGEVEELCAHGHLLLEPAPSARPHDEHMCIAQALFGCLASRWERTNSTVLPVRWR